MGIVLGFLPLFIIGLGVWGIVAIFRQHGEEPVTVAGAAAWYSYAMAIAGVVLAMAGVSLLLKSLIALIDPQYSYVPAVAPSFQPPIGVPGPPTVEQMRLADAILGFALILPGAVASVAHLLLARRLSRFPGGSPSWLARGALVMLTALTGLVGLGSLAIALYQVLVFAVISGAAGRQPFGEMLGTALIFLPVWCVLLLGLVHTLRKDQGPRPGLAPPRRVGMSPGGA